jgi:DNA-binding response OmpR family regulator
MQTNSHAHQKRILIIDDDAALLDILKDFLEDSGFEVLTDDKGSNIFHLIDRFRPNLIILDYLLDGVNGGEICHQVKHHPASKHIPVILYSAYPKVLLSLGTYNCDLFIPKPFDLSRFLNEITKLVFTRSTPPSLRSRTPVHHH